MKIRRLKACDAYVSPNKRYAVEHAGRTTQFSKNELYTLHSKLNEFMVDEVKKELPTSNIKISFPTIEEFDTEAEQFADGGYEEEYRDVYREAWQDCRRWLLNKIETIKL